MKVTMLGTGHAMVISMCRMIWTQLNCNSMRKSELKRFCLLVYNKNNKKNER